MEEMEEITMLNMAVVGMEGQSLFWLATLEQALQIWTKEAKHDIVVNSVANLTFF